MKNKNLTQILKNIIESPAFQNFTSLRWAAKTLALVLTLLAGFLILSFCSFFIIGTAYKIVEDLPRLLEMLILSIILIVVFFILWLILPPFWQWSIRFLTVGAGKKILMIIIGALWFFVLFNIYIYETSPNNEIALSLVLTGLVFWVITLALLLTTDGRTQLLSGIGGYVSIMIFFAGVYYFVFLQKPISFTFSPDITENASLTSETNKQMDQFRFIQNQLFLATIIEGNPQAVFEAAQSHKNGNLEWQRITDSLSIKFVWQPNPPNSDVLHLICLHNEIETYLTARDSWAREPELQIVFGMYYAETPDELQKKTAELITTYKDRLARLGESVVNELSNNPNWNALDFLYFSSMTQIGANFGEIIPNTDFARMIVFLQAFLGLADAGVAIKLFRSKPKAPD